MNSRGRAAVGGCGSGGFYFLGFLGSLIYYIRHADGFWGGLLAILKAFVWPAFVVYDLLGHISG